MKLDVSTIVVGNWELYYFPLANGGRMYIDPCLLDKDELEDNGNKVINFPCWGELIASGDDIFLTRGYCRAFAIRISENWNCRFYEKQFSGRKVKKIDTACSAAIIVVIGYEKGFPTLLIDEGGDVFRLTDYNYLVPIDNERDIQAYLRCDSLLAPTEEIDQKEMERS